MTPARLLAAALAATALALAAPALAQGASLTGYDGSNPFNCELQDVGQGTDFPDPDADPFCVRYDKTNQSVSDLGILDFLLAEPARVAAVAGKCFYYQSDHWRGQLIAGLPFTQTYHWQGGYYVDLARGAGGVAVGDFRIGGRVVDPTLLLPLLPPGIREHFGPGRGGLEIETGIPVVPRCAERAERGDIYRH